jgi:hypothetical protein
MIKLYNDKIICNDKLSPKFEGMFSSKMIKSEMFTDSQAVKVATYAIYGKLL